MIENPVMVPTIVDEPMDFTVVARNPQEMAGAQRSMILWAARKIQAEKELLADAVTNLDTATKSKWKTAPWRNRMNISAKKIEFYKKIKTALEAGYYIVPPFPIEMFAIRTKRDDPKRQGWTIYGNESRPNMRPEVADPLPEGEGQYVSAIPETGWSGNEERKWDEQKKQCVPTGRYTWWAEKYGAVDFPFKLAKAEVLTAAAQAMALKVFDQIGILPRSTSPVTPDPMILGQILAPHRKNAPVTFFIAWWLDTRTL